MISPTEKKYVFPSLMAARDFLESKGYKIPKSKIYRDKDTGKINLAEDGKSVTAIAAWEYAEEHLEKNSVNSTDLKDLQAKKVRNAIRNQDLEYEKKAFELEREQGKYVLRSDFERELAARAAVLDAGFRHLFNMRASEWIALVGGKPDKAADFLQSLNHGLDTQLNEYASTRTFQVLFESNGGGS
jgi:hypothetical protein